VKGDKLKKPYRPTLLFCLKLMQLLVKKKSLERRKPTEKTTPFNIGMCKLFTVCGVNLFKRSLLNDLHIFLKRRGKWFPSFKEEYCNVA
jgi:hypothetical protein